MLLEASNIVSGYYEDVEIIKEVSLKVGKGSIVSIIGPNGAGKSTLLKTIIGFLKPKRGKIVYKDEDVTGLSPYDLKERGVSYIPQDRSIFPQLTVRENLRLGGWILRKDSGKVEESVERAYTMFPILLEKQDAKATLLSGGQARMLEISRGIITDPDLIVLDEPSVGLQPNIATEIYRSLDERGKEGLSVLLVDQNIRDAVSVSDYVYMLETGKVVLEGPSEDFRRRLKEIIRSSIFCWHK